MPTYVVFIQNLTTPVCNVQHPDIVSLCSMAKLFATENCFDIVNTALQVMSS
jgi:alkylation response protein AidB-like acyl-CoA dehydrogenase